ncbi:helix-turn-helix domain-containing protein [Miniphocaeibacter halophilus]|uniref:LexA family transcriptional regulator n=1 Tax=Miniphocaeibacter halophilus TaxID=2931922 RepID=A0AC61MTL9_9FIRM|nr:XRE family transcriptional regulator [Miniphocaeibacter halophilus]QQK07726.1 LexA family transcriptional regulator [Miniphocaeibacter halophilus]
MTLADNIRFLRKKKNMSQDYIAEKLGYKSYTTIQKWESGISEPSLEKLHELSKIFNVDIDYLISKDLTKPENEIIGKVETINSYKYIPDPVSAGNLENMEGQKYSSISIPNNFLGKYANNPDIIIMKVNGDSMNKIIPNESLIGILENFPLCDLKNGDIVVFNDNYNCFVKRFYKTDTKIIFRPESTDESFTDITFDITEDIFTTVKIVGKVVMYNVIL